MFFVYQDHYKLALGQLNAARGMIDKVAQVRGRVTGVGVRNWKWFFLVQTECDLRKLFFVDK